MGWIDLARLHLVCTSPACRDSVQPLDDRLGLTDSLTEAARRLLSLAGGSWSFDSARQHLKTFCGLDASDEFIRKVTEATGAKLAAWCEDVFNSKSRYLVFAPQIKFPNFYDEDIFSTILLLDHNEYPKITY